MTVFPSPEALTAGKLYKLSSELAFSDELGSTNQAVEVSKRGDIVAKLEIRVRTCEYTELKTNIDNCLGALNEQLEEIKCGRQLIQNAREIVTLVDRLVILAADLIP